MRTPSASSGWRYSEAIETAAQKPEYAPYVAALSVLRGIDTVSAMTILAELGDLRRFATAPQLMAAIGLVPGEHSTGDKTVRLPITKAGNAHVRRIAVQPGTISADQRAAVRSRADAEVSPKNCSTSPGAVISA